jgi:ribonucleoside-diphosphate reductase beta chain
VDLPSYNKIFKEELPQALNALTEDPSPQNMAKASVTYNMIVEGVMAETGYFVFHEILGKLDILPSLKEFVAKLKQDESRHVAYGIFLLSRLVAEHGDEVWHAIEQQMQKLIVLAMANIQEGTALYEELPFGLDPHEFDAYAMDQFQKRWNRVAKARSQTLEEVLNEVVAV